MHSSTGIPNNKSLHSFRFGIYVESKHCSQDTDMNLRECKMALLTGRSSLPADMRLQKCWSQRTLLSALPFSSWLVPVFRLLSRFILSFSSARIDRHLALLSSKVDYSVPLCKHYRLGMQNRLRCFAMVAPRVDAGADRRERLRYR